MDKNISKGVSLGFGISKSNIKRYDDSEDIKMNLFLNSNNKMNKSDLS